MPNEKQTVRNMGAAEPLSLDLLAERIERTRRDLANVVLRLDHVEKGNASLSARVNDASEAARKAMQSSSDLEVEVRQSIVAASDAMKGASDEHAKQLGMLTVQLAQLRANYAAVVRENKAQTDTLDAIARWHNHPLIKVAGAILAAAVASYVGAYQGHDDAPKTEIRHEAR